MTTTCAPHNYVILNQETRLVYCTYCGDSRTIAAAPETNTLYKPDVMYQVRIAESSSHRFITDRSIYTTLGRAQDRVNALSRIYCIDKTRFQISTVTVDTLNGGLANE